MCIKLQATFAGVLQAGGNPYVHPAIPVSNQKVLREIPPNYSRKCRKTLLDR